MKKKIKHIGIRKEDYIETIYILSKQSNNVRVKDIAESLVIKKPSVVSMIEKLQIEGLLEHEKYGCVFLTDKGRSFAENIYKKHLTVYTFFKDILGLPKNIAEQDACNIEHYISDSTFEKWRQFIEFFFYLENNTPDITAHLKDYYQESNKLQFGNTESVSLLSDLNCGDEAVVVNINRDFKEMDKVISKGILPGEKFLIKSSSDKQIEVTTSTKTICLSPACAQSIIVQIIPK